MGEMDVMPSHVIAGSSGNDFPAAMRGINPGLFGVLGAGPTGARSRSQLSRFEVTEGLGPRHWGFFFEPAQVGNLR